MRALILICLLVVPLFGNAQEEAEDNLRQQLVNEPESIHDSLYYELFKLHRAGDINKAKRYAKLANEYAVKNENNSIELKSLNALAYVYEKINKIDSAIFYYKKGLSQSMEYNIKQRSIYFSNDLGNMYESLDIYDSALYFYQLSYEFSTATGSGYDQAIALNNSGLIFYRLDNAQEAISYFEEALKIKKSYGITEGVDLNLINIAMCNNELGNYEKAIEAVEELLKLCSDVNKDCSANLIQDSNYQLGLAYEYLKSHDIAKRYFLKCVEEFPDNQSPQTYAGALYHLAYLHFDTDLDKTLSYLTHAELLAKSQKKKRLLKDIYALFSEYYQKIGSFDNSLRYLEKYNSLKDSIFNEKMANNMRNLQLSAQKKKNDEVVKKQQQLLERSNQITNLTAVVAFLALSVAVLLFFLFRTIRTRNAVLKSEVDRKTQLILQSANDLKRTNEKLLKAQSEYQHLVYRSSHDLKGPVTTLLGLINLVKMDGFTNHDLLNKYTDEMQNTAIRLDSLLSQLVYISRVSEEEITVVKVDVKQLLDGIIAKHAGVYPMTKYHNGISENIVIDSDIELLRIALDFLIENAFKYSANYGKPYPSVTCLSDVEGNTLKLKVIDNGVGVDKGLADNLFNLFIVGEGQRGSGIGLYVARKAIERLNGSINITSIKDPTVFTIELPLK